MIQKSINRPLRRPKYSGVNLFIVILNQVWSQIKTFSTMVCNSRIHIDLGSRNLKILNKIYIEPYNKDNNHRNQEVHVMKLDIIRTNDEKGFIFRLNKMKNIQTTLIMSNLVFNRSLLQK